MLLRDDGTVGGRIGERLHARSSASGTGIGPEAGGKRTAQAYEVRPGEKLDTLRQLLYGEKGQTLIFTRTKRGAQRLAKELMRDGFTAAEIHGDRSQSQRNGALSGFQEGRYQVLVATDIARAVCTWTTLPT